MANADWLLLEGAYVLDVMFRVGNDLIGGARRGRPLFIGYGEGAMYLGSDDF